MLTLGTVSKRLASIAPTTLDGTWVRIVPFLHLVTKNPPDWLFTSGKPNRYNPPGVYCVYFADAEQTAKAEYDDYWSGGGGWHQPKTTYFAEVHLQRVLDLTDPVIVSAIGIKNEDLSIPWRMSKKLVLPQLIGKAVSDGSQFSGIIYRSNAAQKSGVPGRNVVIFQESDSP